MGKYRKSPGFAKYYIREPFNITKEFMKDAVSRLNEAKKDDPIMATTNLFRDIINIHPFEDGDKKIGCLILKMF